ncbi:molybdopterin-dependent oxidoreductase [Sphingosinicellaceae bacterium]|nr:molybdopterin-dependent oxidoreductase [Sphingosinicellaceae bacterium]
MSLLTRRGLLTTGALGGGLLLAGCDKLTQSDGIMKSVQSAENLTYRWQRLIGRDALAQEFTKADISPVFKPNGTTDPQDDDYQRHAAQGFVNWKLKIDGLVERPSELSLSDLHRLAQRDQITRHDCVEGWSAIGEWAGPQLGTILKTVGLKPNARYVVFHCADNYGGEISKGGAQSSGLYYESIDLVDAFHPQTILALSMNGAPLDVAHGAPCRMRIERQLGYKQAKYVMRCEVVDSFAKMELGQGGYWEDRGYEWYAGI